MADKLGDYALERVLGSTPGSCVYLARAGMDTRCAVKLFRVPNAADGETLIERMLEGVARIRDADIPGVIRHLGAGHDDGGAWVALEYRPEPTLEEVLEHDRPDVPTVLTLIDRLAATLDQCHRSGVVVRDFRPANVFLTADGPLLTDLVGVDRLSSLLLQSELLRERAIWATPEVVLGYRQTPASNRYTLGQIATVCLTGKLPFSGATADYLYSMVYEKPSLDAVESEEAGVVLSRALAPGPEARFETCQAFANALRVALGVPADAALAEVAPLEVELPWLDAEPEEDEEEAVVESTELQPEETSEGSAAADSDSDPGPDPVPDPVPGALPPGPAREQVPTPGRLPPRTRPLFSSADIVREAVPGAIARGNVPAPEQESHDPTDTREADEGARPTLRLVAGEDPQGAVAPVESPPPADPEETPVTRPGSATHESKAGTTPVPPYLQPSPPSPFRRIVRALFRGGQPERRPSQGGSDRHGGYSATGGTSTGAEASPMPPQWSFEVRTAATEATVLVDGEPAGSAEDEIVVRRRAGATIHVEVRSAGRTVAATDMRLHPFMDRVWDADQRSSRG